MIRALRCALLTLTLALSASSARAQVTTGTPPFASYGGGPETLNLANLNANWTIPVLHKPGRGTNFTYDLIYDSSIWSPVGSSGHQNWQPPANWGWRGHTEVFMGYLAVPSPSGNANCMDSNARYLYYWYGVPGFTYHDAFGVGHTFPGSSFTVFQYSIPSGYTPYPGECDQIDPPPHSITSLATDGSGLTLNAGGNPLSETITTSSGTVITPPTTPSALGMKTDRNGNLINTDGNGHFYDTLSGSSAVLTAAGTGTPSSPVTFTYTAPSGSATYKVVYRAYTVQTKFACSGVSEYGPISNNLVSEIDLPDYNPTTNPNSRYLFTYETTYQDTHSPHYVTGRIASVQLPTGGTISYQYSTGGTGVNGISCSDGSVATIIRTTPDGTWTYARAQISGSHWQTTITDPTTPTANQTLIDFQAIYETARQIYQGSTSGTLLKTVYTCYNGSASPCAGTAVALPISRRTEIIQLPNSAGKQCEHDTFYNSNGLVTEVDDYDCGSGVVGTLIRQTLTSYAFLGNGIVDRPGMMTVLDGGGALKAKASFGYDQTSVAATTGTPQHISITGSRGNVTTVQSYNKDGNNFLNSTATYFDTGNVQIATDVNNGQTTYTYGACGNSFPTSVTEAVTTLSVSATWDCRGGVLTSVTDENLKQTSITYSDPYYWRPATSTDQTSVATNFCYGLLNNSTGTCTLNPTQVESTLNFNSNNSTVDTLTTLDLLGRAHIKQARQLPTGTYFDSREQDFDSLGRPSRSTLPYNATAGQVNSTAPATTNAYDPLGRVLTTTDSGGGSTTYLYTQNDVLVTVGPPPGGEHTKQRQLEYDGLGRLTSVCELTSATGSGTCGQTVSQTGYWTKYTYDVLGNLLTVTQNAQAASGSQQTRSYTYDFLSRLTSETNAESGTTNYTYDTDTTCGTSSSDQVKRVDAVGDTVCFAYDALHRATGITYPSGPYSGNTPSKSFVYDSATVNTQVMQNAKGRLAEAYTGPSTGKITDLGISYTGRGEVSDVYQSSPHSSGYYHINQTYWAHGAPSQLSQLVGLPTISYGGTIGSTVGLDGEGRITQVTGASGQNPVTGMNYNFYGTTPQMTVTFGSGDSDVFNYDANTARMTQYQFNINGQSDTGALTWNANSTLQKLVISDALANSTDSQTCNYGYDDVVRIASANCGSAAAQTFSYDPFGNISKSGSPNQFLPTYNAATNRFATLPGTTPSYDANGNVTWDGSHNYTWDADGNSVTLDGTGLTFDAFDRAVEKNVSGTYTEIVYAPTGAKLALMSGQTLQKAFASLPGKATAVYTSSGLDHYRHSDWLGSVRLTSSTTRTVLSTAAYAPFGETYAQSGTADVSFTGQNQDTVSGDYDFMYREYSIQGRWPSPDPAGLAAVNPMAPQSWNRYAYVLNNPLGFTDPLGLECVWDNGSYDSANDPETGDATSCKNAGGTWIDPSFFSDFGLPDWSGGANGYLATVVYDLQAGFALVQTGTGLGGWMLVGNGGAGPIDWSLLGPSVPTPTYSQQLFGAAARGMRLAGGVIPTVCGPVGVFGYAGGKKLNGIVEYDSHSGLSAGGLLEHKGVGGVATSTKEGIAAAPIVFVGEGVGGFTTISSKPQAGPFVGGDIPGTNLGYGVGAYATITSVNGCNE